VTLRLRILSTDMTLRFGVNNYKAPLSSSGCRK